MAAVPGRSTKSLNGMGDLISLHVVLIATVAMACCLPLGLLIRSSSESKTRGPEPAMFATGSLIGLIASLAIKLLWVAVLFCVPSLLLLHVMDQEPRIDIDMRLWVFSSLVGVGAGKCIRWFRWRRAQPAA